MLLAGIQNRALGRIAADRHDPADTRKHENVGIPASGPELFRLFRLVPGRSGCAERSLTIRWWGADWGRCRNVASGSSRWSQPDL